MELEQSGYAVPNYSPLLFLEVFENQPIATV